MSKRIISTHQSCGHIVKVYRDSEWSEYQVFTDNAKPSGDAAYFTNDKQDAIDTASDLLARLIKKDREAKSPTPQIYCFDYEVVLR